ncbi:MAG: AI-2E family transporter [Thermodesulfobacteriota bacterium]|nr:AI-2E family transporter [Thermodesulfobacteriota bacterium]
MESKSKSGAGAAAEKGHRPFLLVMLFFALYLAYIILKPFLHTLILAVVLASLSQPLQDRLVRAYRGRSNAAAFTVILAVVFLIALPFFFFVTQLVDQGVESINQVTEWIRAGNLEKMAEHPFFLKMTAWANHQLDFLDLSTVSFKEPLLQFSKNFGQFLISRVAGLLGDMATLVTHFFIMLFVTFYVVRDGREMVHAVKYLSPLREEQEDRILLKVKMVTRSVFLGSFATALCQGIVGGVGLSIVGIPGLFWGSTMAFASLIPLVGTALVWMPAVGYLLFLGKWKSALFLAAWCVVFVGSIDNFLRPFFMRGQSDMSPFYILLAIIGGVQYFGLVGILYGPLILAFAMVMLYIYQIEYRDLLEQEHPPVPSVSASAETEK